MGGGREGVELVKGKDQKELSSIGSGQCDVKNQEKAGWTAPTLLPYPLSRRTIFSLERMKQT